MVRQQFLTGLSLLGILRLLYRAKLNIPKKYWLDVVRLLGVSLPATLFNGLDHLYYHHKIKKTEIVKAPVFIIGHWRSGTTFLQSLISLHKDFCSPTFFQCMLPLGFIRAEKHIKNRMEQTLPARRLFDNMRFSVDEPFDDDFAILKMTYRSPMLVFVLPDNQALQGFGVDVLAKTRKWKKAFLYFAKKLTYVNQKRIVFKSPLNTLRIPEILELFPRARFIYVHRHPLDVFTSSRHHARLLLEHNALQDHSRDVTDYMLDRYMTLFDVYQRDKSLIPEGNLVSVSYQELIQNPMTVLDDLFKRLDLGALDDNDNSIRKFLADNSDYRTNRYQLSAEDKKVVLSRWADAFDAYRYECFATS